MRKIYLIALSLCLLGACAQQETGRLSYPGTQPETNVVSDSDSGSNHRGTDNSNSHEDAGAPGKSKSSGTSRSGSRCASVRCTAITRKGTRCQRMTTNCSGLCWQHQ